MSVPFLGGNENSEHEPGALVVRNQHSLAHVVNLSVSVTETGSVENKNVSGDALFIIENGLEGQIPVDAGETKVYPDFLSGSVMYTVEMWIGSSEVRTTGDANDEIKTAEFSPAAKATPDARGSFLTARIGQNRELSWVVSYVY